MSRDHSDTQEFEAMETISFRNPNLDISFDSWQARWVRVYFHAVGCV